MDEVVVADLETSHEALMARGLLIAHGIPAEMAPDRTPGPSMKISSTRVVVPAAYAEEARALLPDPSPPAGPTGRVEPGPGPARAPARGADTSGPWAANGSEPGSLTPNEPPLSATPLAASRASRPRWVVVLLVLLVALVGWLLLEISGLLGQTGHDASGLM